MVTIIASTVLNAAYFLPIVFAVWFGREAAADDNDHGEAPLAAVLALTVTAALTMLFFLFNGPVIALERQLRRSAYHERTARRRRTGWLAPSTRSGCCGACSGPCSR